MSYLSVETTPQVILTAALSALSALIPLECPMQTFIPSLGSSRRIVRMAPIQAQADTSLFRPPTIAWWSCWSLNLKLRLFCVPPCMASSIVAIVFIDSWALIASLLECVWGLLRRTCLLLVCSSNKSQGLEIVVGFLFSSLSDSPKICHWTMKSSSKGLEASLSWLGFILIAIEASADKCRKHDWELLPVKLVILSFAVDLSIGLQLTASCCSCDSIIL